MHLSSTAYDFLADSTGLLVGGWCLVGRKIFSRWCIVFTGRTFLRLEQTLDFGAQGQEVIDVQDSVRTVVRDELLESLEVRHVSEGRRVQQSIVNAHYLTVTLVVRLPLDITLPEPIGSTKIKHNCQRQVLSNNPTREYVKLGHGQPEFEAASIDSSLVLFSQFVLVFFVERFTVVNVVQPQVHAERYGLKAFVEHLRKNDRDSIITGGEKMADDLEYRETPYDRNRLGNIYA